MNDLSVFVLRSFDGVWPSRVAVVMLAKDRYDAIEMAEEWLELRGAPKLEETNLEVFEAMEEDELDEVYKV